MDTILSETITIKELLNRYPKLVSTFIDLGLMCAGCPTEAFHTLADVVKAYGLHYDDLAARLQNAIDDP